MVGRVIKEVAEAALKESDKAVKPTIKITEDIRAPFRDLGLKPVPRDGGGLDLFDQTGNPVGTYDSVEDALSQLSKQEQQPGITAYHGSPYRFDEFKSEAIGTGEGAQAYGHGLYFAEAEDVAKGYRDALSKGDITITDSTGVKTKFPINPYGGEGDIADVLRLHDFETARNIITDPNWLNNLPPNKQKDARQLSGLIGYAKGAEVSKGKMYEVNLKTSLDELLDWDKPLSQQPQKVQEALSDIFEERAKQIKERSQIYTRPVEEVISGQTGSDIYDVIASQPAYEKWVKEQLNSGNLKISETNTPASVSKFLESRGIKGIRYDDAMSRGTEGGTSNFVIFDPRIIAISKKYGVAIPVAATMVVGSSIAPQRAQADTVDAINATVDGEATPEQMGAIRNYVELQSQNIPQTGGGTVFAVDQINLDPPVRIQQPAFAKDDATGKLLTQYEDGNVSASERAYQEYLAKQKQEKGVLETAGEAVDTAGAVVADIGGGLIEAPRMVLSGFLRATAEMAEVIEKTLGLPEGKKLLIEQPARTTTGAVIGGVSQFLTGFLPAMRALKGAGLTTAATPWLAGAFADAAGFDAHEARLSDLIQEYPALQNPVTEYLQSDPTDTEAEGRFKNALEGAALGGLIEPFVKVVKFIRSRGEAKAVAAQEGATVTEAIEADPEIAGQLQTITQTEQEFIPFREQMGRNSAQFEFKAGSTAADPEAAANINLNNIETPDDVKTFIDRVAEADAQDINEARRQVITNVELPKLADDLGMTVDDLLARRQGEAFNAEQILAARKILIASGEHLIKLAKKASTGGDMDLAMFRRAMAQHKAIQAQVSGMTAEAGRALQSFNIVAASSREQERAIKEALEASGGMEVNQKMAQMMSQLDDPAQVGKFVKDASKATNMDMLYEGWINGLLSSPTTHAVNALSNVMVAALTVGERKVASALGQSIPPGEATAQAKGMVDGARDGLRLAWQALKTGEPSDVMQKVEVDQHKAISAENLNIGGYPAVFANYLGNMVRIPGRLLTTADEFFKAVGYRMELHAQAYRQAFNEGLTDEAAAKRVLEIINDPPENIRMAAVDASRYQTFTNSLSETRIRGIGEIGQVGESVRRKKTVGPYARVIIPFVRTPTNIMSYTFERTPLALLSKSVREELNAGGARRDLALGKIAAGSMIMAVAADLALSGQITGAGPADPKLKNIKRATGWQPYSIKSGDKYYAYNRLDPVGALIGLSADMSEIMGQVDEATADQLATAAVLSIVQNMSSKTYMSGVTELLDAIDSSSTDPEANNYKLTRYLQRLAGSMVPASVANIERVMSPEMSATYGYIDRVKSRIPGYSADLPPRRNIFGEPVVLEGGIGPDIMSPIYTSTDKKDPVADEIVRQKTSLSMPRRVVNNVELSPQQYDRYVLLYSGEGLKGTKGKTLKDALKEMFASSQYKRATDGPEGGKSLMIQSIFTAYRDAAKAQLISEDATLQTQIKTEERERIEKLTGR
jgi:hypothetical protein